VDVDQRSVHVVPSLHVQPIHVSKRDMEFLQLLVEFSDLKEISFVPLHKEMQREEDMQDQDLL